MADNHIFPFLWMRGETEEVLHTEMEKIYEAGIRAVCLEARPHPDYVGEGWWHDVDIIIDEAKKRGMQIWILDDAHFPTGMANNGMSRHADKARRFLYTQFVDVTGPLPSAQVDVDLLLTKQFTWMDIGKPVTPPLYDETRLFSVTASRICCGDVTQEEPIDLTAMVKDGYLTADIPEGTWRINVNFITTAIGPKPEYINYIEEDSVRVLIDEVYEKHFERYHNLFGTTIAGFFSDEPGFYNTDTYDENCYVGLRMPLPWGRELESLLKEKYGEDLERDITYLFAEDENGAHRKLRVAYMDAVSYLYGKNFNYQLGDWCRAHGVEYIGHVVEDNCGYMRLGAGVGHYFRSVAGQDMAGIDNIGYQLMPGNDIANRHTGFQDIHPDFYHYALAKLGASAAAFDPKKRGRLMCENFGAYGWRLGVRDMKWLVDYLVAQGVNYFVPHAFSMAEYPDVDCPPHFYARGNNPQFPYFCELMRYTDKLCRLFSGGISVQQAAVLFEAESDWAGKTMRGYAIGRELITHQIDFLFVPTDVFTNGQPCGCTVENNTLSINGRTMQVLIVPECEYIPEGAAAFIASHPDLTVLYVNKYPKGIAGQEGESAECLLESASANRAVVPLEELGMYLRNNGVMDVLNTEKTDGNLHQYHYQKDGKDYYLLMNSSLSEHVDLEFVLPQGKNYGVYDAWEEKTVKISGSTYHLKLAPYQSVILCSDPCDAALQGPEFVETGRTALEDFSLELREIGKKETEKLEHFKLRPISSINRDFSGTMTYRTNLTVDKVPAKAVFSAQYVFEVMKLTVNGKSCMPVIHPPYEQDIAALLREGKNEIVIETASTALRNANTMPGLFGKERTIIEPTGMFGDTKITFYEEACR
ncbi:MAG: glycoside hydrolase family 2 [Lachnospiraceae bacterium]|nr:glycoside hydrolase family 2 [Lachnospiraceae bacterium]